MIESMLSEVLGKQRKRISTVAKETGISRTTLTAMYYGTSGGVSFAVLDRLCENLNCSPGDLLKCSEVEKNA